LGWAVSPESKAYSRSEPPLSTYNQLFPLRLIRCETLQRYLVNGELFIDTLNGGQESMFPKEMEVASAERPLRIAIVYSRIPLPMRRADQMTVAHLLSFLKARGHTVDLFCIKTGAVASAADEDWLKSACRTVKFYKHDWRAYLRAPLFALLRATPLQVGYFSHPKQQKEIHSAVKAGDYDVVYTYYLRSAEMVRGIGRRADSPREGKAPATFLALQLSQALNARRIAENAPNPWIKWLYRIESRLMARYESTVWQDFTRTVLIGQADVEEIQNNCRSRNKRLIDNFVFGAHGTDVDLFAPRTDIPVRPRHLVFSGVMRTPTNVQAVQWFANKVWPKVRAAVPDATWSIVGREPAAEVRRLARLPGVEVTGTVNDPSSCIAQAEVCINPMQAGGGMQNKLIEYLASAKPTVATSVANEGLGATNGRHLLIADQPDSFADAVIELLRNPAYQKRLGSAAREYVLSHWTWEAHFLKLEESFYDVLKKDEMSFVAVPANGNVDREASAARPQFASAQQ
jgi:glycosyltransferase involved in cell wall biosynthesis